MPRTSIFVSATVSLALAAAAGGSTETVRFDVPSAPLSIFGVQLTIDYLGPPEGVIAETRAELAFTTDESFDAADIMLSFQAPSEGVPVWELSGADLGWSGAGTFEASLTTDALNGLIDLGDPPPDFSLFLLVIVAEGLQPLGGQFTRSFFEVDIAAPLPGDLNADCTVDTSDLLALLAMWGACEEPCPPTCEADLDGDCQVGTTDLLVVLANWS